MAPTCELGELLVSSPPPPTHRDRGSFRPCSSRPAVRSTNKLRRFAQWILHRAHGPRSAVADRGDAAGRWWLQLEASGALRVQLFPGRQAQTAIRNGERRDAAAWGLRPYFAATTPQWQGGQRVGEEHCSTQGAGRGPGAQEKDERSPAPGGQRRRQGMRTKLAERARIGAKGCW